MKDGIQIEVRKDGQKKKKKKGSYSKNKIPVTGENWCELIFGLPRFLGDIIRFCWLEVKPGLPCGGLLIFNP